MASDRYNNRRGRRQYRGASYRRRMNLLVLVVSVVLVGALVLCLSMCSRGEDVPPDDGQGSQVQPGGDAVQPGGDGQTGDGAQPGGSLPVDTRDEWNLILVNPWNPVPDGYEVELTSLPNGLQVDKRCYSDLSAMLDAIRAEGMTPVVCSAYRTQATQQQLYDNMVQRYLGRGYTQAEAETLAAKEVAVPGTSEHQLGLAVDIVDIEYQMLDKGQESTAVQKWLMGNCWRYGFILRYPTEKTDVTGIIYEPWHYRYVGKDRAKEIYDSGLCLEEWLAQN